MLHLYIMICFRTCQQILPILRHRGFRKILTRFLFRFAPNNGVKPDQEYRCANNAAKFHKAKREGKIHLCPILETPRESGK